jgi:hypothetical protein
MAKKDAKQPAGSGDRKKNTDQQTRGQYERDPKLRKGHYTGAGEAPIKK